MKLLAVVLPEDPTLAEAREHGARHGLVLVTDGRELRYAMPHAIPPGYLRFALFARRAPEKAAA